MAKPIARKKDTGEAGNPGHFGSTARGESEVEFEDTARSAPADPSLIGETEFDVEPNNYGDFPAYSSVWYDADEDVTTLSTTIDIRADRIIGLPDPSEDGRTESDEDEALRMVAYDVVEQIVRDRNPGIDVDREARTVGFGYWTERSGRANAEQMMRQEIEEGKIHRLAQVSETASGYGELEVAFRERSQATLAAEDVGSSGYYGISSVDEEAMAPEVAAWNASGGTEIPVPTDHEARKYAFHVMDGSPEARSLNDWGYANRDKLLSELDALDASRGGPDYMSHSLRVWAGQAQTLDQRLQGVRDRQV